MKNYIITGGAGFIGSKLAHRLLKNGGKIYIIDDLSTGFKRSLLDGALFLKADIGKFEDLLGLKLPVVIDTVFHLAAQSSGEASFDDPIRDIETNYKGTYNVLKLAETKKCKRFIYASSMSVYGKVRDSVRKVSEEHECCPESYYGCNKLASEKLIKIFLKGKDMKPTILRLFSVYGPGQNMLNMKQGIVSIYLSYLLNNKPIHVKGGLDRFRDLIYIDDAVEILTSCEDKPKSYGQTFNVGTGVKTTVRRLIKVILRVYGKKGFDKWMRCEGNTPGDIMGCVADIKKAKTLLGWKPKYSLDEGIGKMKTWLDETQGLWVKK